MKHRYRKSRIRHIKPRSRDRLTNPKALIIAVWLIYVLVLAVPQVCHGQSLQCWTWSSTTKTWVYNQACAGGGGSPWQILPGKTFTVDNTLTLLGTDNASLNIGAGGTLGSAAFASSNQFQPAGGGANSSCSYGGSLTIGTGANGGGSNPSSITITTGLSFSSNMLVLLSYTSNGADYMYGSVTSYNPTTGAFTVNVTNTGGSGTFTGWNISVAGAPGPTGPTGSSGTPVGGIIAYGGTSAPTNYFLCNGAQYSCGTYASLCAVLGNTWGGDGVNTFNVPNLQGRFPLGAGQGATAENGGTGTNRTLGQVSNGGPGLGGTVYGAETHTQSLGELAAHSHSMSNNNLGLMGTISTYGTGNVGTGLIAGWGPYYTSTSGSGSPMSIMNPFAVVNYIIRYQ